MAIRIRRGTDAQRAAVTFLDGEIIWTTDTQEFYVGDGVTVGGILIGPIAPGGFFVTTVNLVPPTLGNIQLTVSNSGTGGTLQWNALDLEIPQADTNTTGLLSDIDWNTFNSKLDPTRQLTINGVTFDLSADRVWSVGTVTSVDITVPSILSVSGNPITTSGTFAVTLANQSANKIFAGPAAGAPAAPTFRDLVVADIPDLSAVYQPLDSDLTAIAALTPANDDIIQRKAGAWTNRTIAQYYADLQASVKNDAYFTIYIGPGNAVPLDATTYFFNMAQLTITTVDTDRDFQIGVDCTLIAVIMTCSANTTQGTSEDSSLYWRNTTDATSSLLGTFKTNATSTTMVETTMTGLSVDIDAADYVCPEWRTPTWVTNPAATFIRAHFIFKRR